MVGVMVPLAIFLVRHVRLRTTFNLRPFPYKSSCGMLAIATWTALFLYTSTAQL